MKADVRENGFDQAVNGWVRGAFARGARSFPELVRLLPGVYPADALRATGRLRQELPVGWHLSNPRVERPPLDGWPVEHPLDFDWRFTPETVRLLVDRCPSPGTDSVAFLGAPSLAREAAARGWRTGVSLFDKNPALVAALRASFPEITAVCTDLVWGEPVDLGDAVVAIADPPWYPEHTIAFLWAASRLTRVGRQVLISLPPEGTRPGILAEREAFFAGAETFGLRLVSVEEGVLAYQSPPFEKNALAAAGVPAVPWDWRRGDLARFVTVGKTVAGRPSPPGTPDAWEEESVGNVRIKSRTCAEDGFRDPTLSSVVPGDILASVSRRDAARATADVWTSGNRIFRCDGTGVFRTIVSALGRGANVEDAVTAAIRRKLTAEEAALVRRAAAQAADLVRREERELAEDVYPRHERELAEAV
jgi:hypothetical protein